MSEYEDDDCEDQGCVPTDVCLKFDCQSWQGNTLIRPRLIKRGNHWVCPNCHASYGKDARGDIQN